MKRRRLFAPEVVQASAMDCGPASLKCLLEGHGVPVSFGRLREACQTDVDGTSIDTIEEIAVQLGLEAEQVMVPVDHLLLREARCLPAIVVVCLPNGTTHFVVAWRRHGPLIQVMDPGSGRRWMTRGRLLQEVYLHTSTVPADDWREWAGSEAFLRPLRSRMERLGMRAGAARRLAEQAGSDPGWRSLAALDASVRMTAAIVSGGGLRRGREAAGVVERLMEGGAAAAPPEYWSVQPDGDRQLRFRGAVLVHVHGLAPRAEAERRAPLAPELAAALEEPPSRPGGTLLRLLRAGGLFAPGAILAALALAAAAVLCEAVLFRGVFELARELGLSGQRIAAVVALLLFLAALLLLEFPVMAGLLRLGRHLEARMRAAFLQKIPRLGDRYFQSRLTSDMAERSHSIHQIRHLPELGADLLRAGFELLFTVAGIAWLDPPSAPLAAAAAGLALLLPLFAQPALTERDLRVRSHLGAISRFYLDSLLGLVALRAHGAERAVRREHESLLLEWARASFGLQRVAVAVEAIQFLGGFALAAWLLAGYVSRNAETGGVLLLIYWSLNLPVLGQEVAMAAWQYPAFRNLALRLLEPLGALEEPAPDHAPVVRAERGPADLAFEAVSVRASGHTILEDIRLRVPAGGHVAIVGPSGSGKSSLVGLLLGWHRPAEGAVLVDGEPLDAARVHALRREVAWVDPAVHLWNRSLLDNLSYGAPGAARHHVAEALDAADLREVLERLPDGLQTRLGEGGALVSGGEGQRVRLGRAVIRPGVRLAILDEPFRGLGREQRRDLLARARKLWHHATLLCITHDVGETRSFPRVLVIEGGRLVEDGAPAELAARPGSRYRAMLEAEQALREGFWSDHRWRAVRIADGALDEEPRKEGLWRAI
jgi:ATP-binding cassette subfamily B protein